MKIAIIGTGYVGLITGVGFASLGHSVTAIDIDPEKVKLIQSGKSPLYEEGLESLLQKVLNNGFTATTDFSAVDDAEFIFVCVGTPSREDGSIDLSYIQGVMETLGPRLKDRSDCPVIIIKSTVVPMTTEEVCQPILEKTSTKKVGTDFGLCMSPEFLREGKALEDFMNPSRIVLGCADSKSDERLTKLYQDFKCPILHVDSRTAEMIKYAANSFLATKISFINELGNICKELGINTFKVSEALGLDPRISPQFLNPGIGFGGSCLPKDVRALIAKSKELGYNSKLLEQVLSTNTAQVQQFLNLIKKEAGSLKGKKIAVLGLAFKPGTDDIRESPAIALVQELLKLNSEVAVYDPQAMNNAKAIFGDQITYASSAQDALRGADFCIVATDWPEFKELDFSVMKTPLIFEGRKLVDSSNLDAHGMAW